jgi:hypothetical protein
MARGLDNMDLKSIAEGRVKSACRMMLQDLQALPDEAFTQTFGPATRTVADIVYEVTLVNDHVGMVIRCEKPFDWPEGGWIKAPETLKTKEDVIGAFEKSSATIQATIEGLSPAEIEEPFEVDGKETTRFERCLFVALHMWYHSGQFNFVQTMLGDDGWHWS